LIGVPDYRQESLRCKQRVRLSAAQLGHPFTHRRCPLRHEFTGPPRRADSSLFRYLPAAVAHDVPAPAEIREDASRQSLQPTMLSKRAPCVSTDSRATSSHSRDPRCLCAPQFRIAPAPWAGLLQARLRTLVRIAKCHISRWRRLTARCGFTRREQLPRPRVAERLVPPPRAVS